MECSQSTTTTEPHARLTRLRIRGVRTFEDVTLDLRAGVTVLIGENGSGKSTVLECLEILRRAATPGFFDDFHTIHGGLHALLRRGAPRMELTASFEHPTLPSFTYRIALATVGGFTKIEEEELQQNEEASRRLFSRDRSGLAVQGKRAELTAVTSTSLRESTLLSGRTDRLERFGANLANAWASLRSEYGESHWQRTMELVRLGLGDPIETVTTRADPAGGAVALWLKFRGADEPIPPSSAASTRAVASLSGGAPQGLSRIVAAEQRDILRRELRSI